MNHCNTPGGQRQLRSNLLEPLTDINTLNARYELVQQLLSDEDKFFDLNKLLTSLTLADRMCALFAFMKKTAVDTARQCSQTIMNILVLKGLLQTLPKLATVKTSWSFLCACIWATMFCLPLSSCVSFPLLQALGDYTSPLVADMLSHFSSDKAATLLTAICEKIEPNAALGNASDHIISRNQVCRVCVFV
jgi:DNA mismatch repair protein MSH4